MKTKTRRISNQGRAGGSTRTGLVASIVAGSLALATSAEAATLVSYSFDDGGANFVNAPASIVEHLSAGAWSDADGTLTTLNGLPPPGLAIAARSWHDGNNFEFTLTVAPGYVLELNGYAFDEQASNGGQGLGPTDWSMSINALEVASGSAFRGPPGGSHADVLALGGLTGDVVVRIFALGSESSALPPADNADNASWRIDDFSLTGTVSAVPLPAAGVLFGSALLVLGLRGRRSI